MAACRRRQSRLAACKRVRQGLVERELDNQTGERGSVRTSPCVHSATVRVEASCEATAAVRHWYRRCEGLLAPVSGCLDSQAGERSGAHAYASNVPEKADAGA